MGRAAAAPRHASHSVPAAIYWPARSSQLGWDRAGPLVQTGPRSCAERPGVKASPPQPSRCQTSGPQDASCPLLGRQFRPCARRAEARVPVTCWLAPAAAESCRPGTRCSRRPCSGPCTWRCISAGRGKCSRLSQGRSTPNAATTRAQPPPPHAQNSSPGRGTQAAAPRPRRRRTPRQAAAPDRARVEPSARQLVTRAPHHPRVPGVSPAPSYPRSPRASRYTSGNTCPSSSVDTGAASAGSARGPRRQPRRAPYLQQLLRVGHGDLHLHLLHDGPRVQLPATRATEVRAEAAVHGYPLNPAAAARADPQAPEAEAPRETEAAAAPTRPRASSARRRAGTRVTMETGHTTSPRNACALRHVIAPGAMAPPWRRVRSLDRTRSPVLWGYSEKRKRELQLPEGSVLPACANCILTPWQRLGQGHCGAPVPPRCTRSIMKFLQVLAAVGTNSETMVKIKVFISVYKSFQS